MRLDIQSAVALGQHGRRTYGTARWIEGRRVAFTTHGEVTVGERLEMRLELTGAYDSIWAEIMIETARPIGLGGPQFCTGDIVYIPTDDRDRLELWVEERSVSQITLQRDSVSCSTATSRSTSGRGRKAIGEALLGRLNRPVKLRRRNWAAIQLSKDGSLLTVVWSTWQGLAADWTSQLSKNLYRVDTANTCPPRGYRLTVGLSLPDGQVLAVQAQVTATDSHGMLLALDLPPATRSKLNRASQRL